MVGRTSHEAALMCDDLLRVVCSSSSQQLAGMRILFLHGFTQNADLFARKASAIRKALGKRGHETKFISGPYVVDARDLPFQAEDGGDMRSWWEPNEQSPEFAQLDKAFETVKRVVSEEGHFDAVVGFSQGAGLAAVLCQTIKQLIPDHPEFRLCVLYSGFRLNDKFDQTPYATPITTPSLHVMGTLDTIVSESRSMALFDLCDESSRALLTHPGGHYVPSQKPVVESVLAFVEKWSDRAETDASLDKKHTEQGDADAENWDEFDKIGG